MLALFDSPLARRVRSGGAPHAPLVVAHSAAAPAGRGPESPLAKFLIGGAVTIVFETSGGHFVEFMKIAKQTSTDSYWQIARKVTATKGLAGTLDGFFPWGAMQAVAKGSVFSFGQAWSMGIMHGWTSMSKDTKTVVSGGAGGFIQGLAMSPLLLLKTRVMTDPAFRSMSGGVLSTAAASFAVGARVVTQEGPAALFKGVGVFSAKRALDWTTRYLFVVWAENALGKQTRKLSDLEVVVATLVGGSASALSTIPMDVLVAGKQSAGSAGKKMGVWETLQEKVKEKGWGGLAAYSTRGLVARCIHVALTTLMMKSMTTVVYDVLYPIDESKAKTAPKH